MKLFSYILAYDAGSAPNPYHGHCTLAICKPTIRRVASPGDWVIATGPARHPTHRKLVYAMRISEILPLAQYFTTRKFKDKKPDPSSHDPRRHVGDNLYSILPDGTPTQLPGPHYEWDIDKDLRGKNALIASHFYYFGHNAIPLPPSFEKLIHTNQGHRSNFPNDTLRRFIQWLTAHHTPGVHGHPIDAPPSQWDTDSGNCTTRPPKNC